MDANKREEILHFLNHWGDAHMGKFLDIVFTEVTEDSLTATMPVTPKVHQPFGLLHGGASCVLAETLGSCLSNIHLDQEKYYAVGTNINSNHLKSKRYGTVIGTAKFIRKGKTMHVSEIEIRDERGDLINYTTMTNNVLAK
ncbi:PaaI family thioesterase [Riemerella columbina]|uniref:PaaI family thioesterase n=1 Tax=Riemerella columbina TaxID=103810 RepID=UPI00267080AB|nr:hotdog fold thioesterase [Riemerella columbina]WKS95785.1 hotdog fold thioesterase [Riemerella columbina]